MYNTGLNKKTMELWELEIESVDDFSFFFYKIDIIFSI